MCMCDMAQDKLGKSRVDTCEIGGGKLCVRMLRLVSFSAAPGIWTCGLS